jgi:hypothetical protein
MSVYQGGVAPFAEWCCIQARQLHWYFERQARAASNGARCFLRMLHAI